jgi:hypothetical protein
MQLSTLVLFATKLFDCKFHRHFQLSITKDLPLPHDAKLFRRSRDTSAARDPGDGRPTVAYDTNPMKAGWRMEPV